MENKIIFRSVSKFLDTSTKSFFPCLFITMCYDDCMKILILRKTDYERRERYSNLTYGYCQMYPTFSREQLSLEKRLRCFGGGM